MPREVFGPGYAFVPRNELLTLEEIARIAQVFAMAGMRKVRITGGEPMIRRDFFELLEYSIGRGIGVKFSTNGAFIDATKAKRLTDDDTTKN